MPDLVNDDADQELLLAPRVGAVTVLVGISARTVEGDHRVFHAAYRAVHGLRGRVRVGERVARVDLHRVDDGLRRIARP